MVLTAGSGVTAKESPTAVCDDVDALESFITMCLERLFALNRFEERFEIPLAEAL